MDIRTLLDRFQWLKPDDLAMPLCAHDHQLANTGAIFFQSQGLLYCNRCKGFQLIRHPLK